MSDWKKRMREEAHRQVHDPDGSPATNLILKYGFALGYRQGRADAMAEAEKILLSAIQKIDKNGLGADVDMIYTYTTEALEQWAKIRGYDD